MSNILLIPRITEKAYAQSQAMNVYVFTVPMDANKMQIKAAVQAEYDVTVTNVRTLVQDGKKARSIRIKQRGRYVYGTRKDTKRAYVTVKAGDEIPVFAEITDGGDE